MQLMQTDLAGPRPVGLEPLLHSLQTRFGSALQAIVLYGSTRRSDNPRDGLVDLMAVVDDYRAAHGTTLTALMNRLLPPNVYYLEAGDGSERLRCKYIVISADHLARRTAGGLDGYFWARFTQPCRLAFARDESAAMQVATCRAQAAVHFAREASSRVEPKMPPSAFWEQALRLTYGCELRPEPPGAAATLIGRDPEFWNELSERLPPLAAGSLSGRLRWPLRRIWSRMLNILRLFKAAGTFANGIDYLSWKLERHSGIRVEPTERMRRHPRLAAWGLLFRLIRSGALR
ncbi:MAG: hypothetical protein RQ729_00500 [Wenzhouxiangellaceae bacterium]|nr:hypothetical protein [Wenzhouxiangellaceae bacterium]